MRERTTSNVRHTIWYGYRGQSNTVFESTFVNTRHAVGDCDGGKARAIKRTNAKICHAIGDGDGGQSNTVFESIIANSCHAVGDGNGGKARAISKSIFIYTRHAVGDGDGSKARATREYASCFMSDTCTLNGRKVMTWFL